VGTETIQVLAVYRPGDEDALTVLRLLAAANDLSSVARLMPGTRGVSEDTREQQDIANAERRYLMRMSVLHFREVMKLANTPDLDRVVERCARRGGKFRTLPELAAAFRENINGPLRKVIEPLRNGFGGHYDREAFAGALKLLDDTDFMDMPLPPTTAIYFNVTDRLFDAMLVKRSHAGFKQEDVERSVGLAMSAMAEAADNLLNLAIGLSWAMYYEAQDR
jgi:hypothetical protein